MNPRVVAKLSQEVPEYKEFVQYLAVEAEKLNTLADISLNAADEIAIEVKARKQAYVRLCAILSPLVVFSAPINSSLASSEYNV